MSIIFLVSADRFVKEAQRHVKGVDGKCVNWFVNPVTNKLLLFLSASHSNEVFCYEHDSVSLDSLPISIKELISKDGEVLGVNTNLSVISSFYGDSNNKTITFNSVVDL